MLYQVYIPAIAEGGFNITLKLEAPNWISALRSGLSKLGEQGDVIKNVMVEMGADGSILVSDPHSGRVFEIRDLSAGEPGPAEPAAAPTPEPPAPDDAAETQVMPAYQPPEQTLAGQRWETVKPGESLQPVAESAPLPGASSPTEPTKPLPAMTEEPAPKPEPKAKQKQKHKAKAEPKPEPKAEPKPEPKAEPKAEPVDSWENEALDIDVPATLSAESMKVRRPGAIASEGGKAVEADPSSRILHEEKSAYAPEDATRTPRPTVFRTEEVLADVFMDAQHIYDFDTDLQGAVEFSMDLLLKMVPAEAGSILFADINENDLYFATARGPKGDEVMNFRVPMGKGIVGFCAKEGVGLTITDVKSDPRHYKRIGESVGFDTRTIVCAPIEADGRCYGAVELINKRGYAGFSPGEMSVVSYVANRLADHINQVVMREA